MFGIVPERGRTEFHSGTLKTFPCVQTSLPQPREGFGTWTFPDPVLIGKKKLRGGKSNPAALVGKTSLSFSILCLCLDLSHFNQLFMTLPTAIRAARSLHAAFVFRDKIN